MHTPHSTRTEASVFGSFLDCVFCITSSVYSLSFKVSFYSKLVGNGTPLQYSCLENPMDGGAW